MKKETGYKSVNRAIDDLPELMDMTERPKASLKASRNVKNMQEEEWIGSLQGAVELPSQQNQPKNLRLSQQVQLDIRSSDRKDTGAAEQATNQYRPPTSQRSPLVESQIQRLSSRLREVPDSASQVIALVNRLADKQRPVSTVGSVLMVDSEPRDILPALLTNPNRLSKYIEALIGLMAHPKTGSQTVQNLQLLVLLLSKLTQQQEAVQVRQTAADIDISFNRIEVRKREMQLAALRRRLAQKDQQIRGMVQQYEQVIGEMQQNIQLLTRQRREYSEDRHAVTVHHPMQRSGTGSYTGEQRYPRTTNSPK